MTDCVSLWIGDRLGPVERACLRSMLRHGNRVSLYCYTAPLGVPEGVVLRDASSVLGLDELRARCGDRSDVYSDWFRYLLLRRGLGTWLDMDVYVIGEIDGERPYLFGKEEADIINGAVLRLPPGSALLSSLLKQFEQPRTPYWLPRRQYYPLRLRELLAGVLDLKRAPWGMTGPNALTALAREHGVDSFAEPQARFYPVSWRRADWILDPAVRLEDVVSRETVAIHLWNECIKAFKEEPAPAGSFLRRLQDEGGQE